MSAGELPPVAVEAPGEGNASLGAASFAAFAAADGRFDLAGPGTDIRVMESGMGSIGIDFVCVTLVIMCTLPAFRRNIGYVFWLRFASNSGALAVILFPVARNC